MNNTACFIYSDNEKYSVLKDCAVKSFKTWHPDIPLYELSRKSQDPHYIDKFRQVKEISEENNITKCIILGADTITCSRLDEFLEKDQDLLVTLDYNYQLEIGNLKTPIVEGDNLHLNADVLCINNLEVLDKLVDYTIRYKTNYNEQAALNILVFMPDLEDHEKYKTLLVDGPVKHSSVVYNARSKAPIPAGPGEKPWGKYTADWYVKDDKLFSYDDRQIKVFHYCEGFGTLGNEGFLSMLNRWKEEWFNEETKKFFVKKCKLDYFNE